ncbi:uncharacterized protein LOC120272220 [Dioscorea cayenensis subsp. rotundata]|uniref:Uncharacterized protein LOC120272220 n=1 Tax=Dioscorea cayennensis subsp. rotundata TaxID=55577 RepID=A0AB40C7Y2_DIOCR|nr:uncharacterized protein LOC120272220 [Dioscorea cayenensis subsp. rotundata]
MFGFLMRLIVHGLSLILVDSNRKGGFLILLLLPATDIAIYGGYGEDERPLNELLILQLGSEHPNGRYNISMCKIFGNHLIQDKQKFLKASENSQKSMVSSNGVLNQGSHEAEAETKSPLIRDNMHAKRRKIGENKVWEIESEEEEHSGGHDTNFLNVESPRQPKTDQFLRVIPPMKCDAQFIGSDQCPVARPVFPSLIGAEVHGVVDGASDSGYLMTANVNGQIFQGVLFAPVTGFAVPRPPMYSQSSPLGSPTLVPKLVRLQLMMFLFM